MINLKSIRVRNFRAVKEATFKPLENGITGIFGPNGAGKTTFLAATLFALYGVKPPGASQNSLRRTGSKGESSVSVVFTHMGQTVEIIREIKAPNNRIVVNIYVDGVPQTVTSVGAADQWVKTRLGIDANGFMTAFVVRQKELDQLVNAKPAERKAIIERLAGIDTINIALKAAREEENGGKKTIATLGGSEEDSTNAAEALDLTTRRLDKMISERDDYGIKITKLDGALSNLKKKAEAIKSDEMEINRLTTQLEMYAPQIVEAEESVANLPEPIDEALSIEELRDLHKELSTKIETATQEYNTKNAELSSFKLEKQKAVQALEDLDAKISAIAPKPDLKTDFAKRIEDNNKTIESSREVITTAKTKIADFNESLQSLSHADNCPTCQQKLSHPDKIIEGIKELIAVNENSLKDAELSLQKARDDMSVNNEALIAQTTYNNLLGERTVAENQLNDLGDEHSASSSVEALKANLDAVIIERDSVVERGQLLKAYLSVADNRDNIVNKLATLKKNFSDTEAALSLLTDKIGGTEALKELSNVTKMEAELAQLRIEQGEITNQLISLESRVGQEKQAAKFAKEAWERKKELLKKQEVSSLTTDVIEKFRSETIASLAPELSDFATSLISEMTNGDFVEVRLDDEFNPSVVDSAGGERPVSWLSGGEESAVALALRLAIAFLITGGQPELLWLDEVLTAQDADRRNTMLSMIRRLPISQIIMINHTQEAGDVVDKMVEIVPNLIEGSSINEEFEDDEDHASAQKGSKKSKEKDDLDDSAGFDESADIN
jgi:exonuclease SbcC